jgi:sugar lactone lactonase YvrE
VFIGFSVWASAVPYVTGVNPGVVFTGTTASAAIMGLNLAGATGLAFSGAGVTAEVPGPGTPSSLPVIITTAAGAATGAREFSVTTPYGTSNLFGILVAQSANPIRVSAISTTSVMQGTSFSATISGTNLAGATSVLFSGAGVTAEISAASTATSLQIGGTVAANATTGVRTVTVVTGSGSSDPYSGVLIVSTPRPSVIDTVLGTGIPGFSGDGYNATHLFWPTGVAVDGAGNLFLADSGNNRIRKLTPNLVISTVAGNGTAGAGGDNGPATAANLNNPTSVAFDSSGNLFIADTDNHKVRKVTPAGVITTVAGNGTAGFGGEGQPATIAFLNFPNSVAVDSSGNLFIADTLNHRVRRVNSGGLIETVAGDGTPGFGGDNGQGVNAQLQHPAGVSVDANGNVFIADFSNHRIRKLAANGIITTVAGTGIAGSGGDNGPATSAQLAFPADVEVDTAGNLFIADYLNDRVRMVNVSAVINTVAGNGTTGFSGDGGPATAAQLYSPFGVTTDVAGNLYIADVDNRRVRRVNSAGIIATLAGSGSLGFSGDGPAGLFAQVRSPRDAALDPSGNLYVADQDNHRIRKVTPAGAVNTIAGAGIQGLAGDGGPATAARLNFPGGVVFDGSGSVVIADSGNHRIREITPAGMIVTIAGTGTAGFSGDGGPASIAQLNQPLDMARDGAGNLFIADVGNHRIRMITPGGVITTVAGAGVSGFEGDGGPAINAKLNAPTGVAVDALGNIFIADSGNHRVRVVNTSGSISTFAGTGVAEFGGDDGPAASAQLNYPKDVVVDGAGNLFIADESNARVRMVNPSGVITTVAGNGSSPFSGDGGPATAAAISAGALGIDGSGNVFIAGSHRVRKVTFTTSSDLPVVTGISPFSAGPGTVVSATITGLSLNGATAVQFSGAGVTAAINTGGTATSLPITITVAPAAAAGLRTLQVVTAAGTSEAFSGFTVTNSVLQPLITGINPARGIVGTSFPANISGAGLTGATSITFSGAGVTAAIVSGGTDQSLSITISIAANAAVGLRTFTITTPGGTSQPFNGFIVARQTITLISPAIGSTGFSVAATISGTDLNGATSVTVSGAGVTAAITGVATGTSVPVLMTIAAGADPGVRAVTLATSEAVSAPFSGYTVVAGGPFGMITTFAGDGTIDFKGDGGPAVLAGLYDAGHVAVDGAGNVYISDNGHNRIRKVTPNGIIDTVVGNGAPTFAGDNGPALSASISGPTGIVIDVSGNLFISDRNNHRIRKVAPNGIITTVAGTGTAGFSGDGGPATQAQINSPNDLAVDTAGNLYIADLGNHRIRSVSPNGNITTVAGNGSAGFSGDGGQATSASLAFPSGVIVHASGSLFIADKENYRIRKVDVNGVITTVAGSGLYAFVGDGGPALLAGFRTPTSVALDGAGNLLIVDTGNARLRRVNSAGTIETIAGVGTIGFSGDGGPSNAAAVWPTDVAVDANGNLFIADFGNKRVRKVTFLPPARKARGQVTSQ